jgi:glyoxylase-like metal-dependent hydrolase (beta-lactamase superfamily II)
VTETPVRQESLDASEEVDEIAPGVRRLQLPIAVPGLGHVNCYALEDERGFALVDPGLPGPASWDTLVQRLKAAEIPIGRVHTVIVTHSHADHYGGATRVRIESGGSEIVTHESFAARWDPFEDLAPDPAAVTDEKSATEQPNALLRKRTPWGGMPPTPPADIVERMRSLPREIRESIRAPKPTAPLADADTIQLAGRTWVAVHTPGHTADHLCLYDPELQILLSGDHVLPTITPHIGGLGEREDPLRDFFDSLDRVLTMPIATVLPAHGDVFGDIDERVADIHRHHARRLEHLRELGLAEGPMDVVAFSHQLFRERSWGALAESETYAHLEHLRVLGQASTTWDDEKLIYRVREPDQEFSG